MASIPHCPRVSAARERTGFRIFGHVLCGVVIGVLYSYFRQGFVQPRRMTVQVSRKLSICPFTKRLRLVKYHRQRNRWHREVL